MDEIARMQTNLLLIRRAVGWTAEEFGYRIGVTRQTINNIEAGRNKLTKTQYIAMRSVLDAEIRENQEDTKMLQTLLHVIVDDPDCCTEQELNEMLAKANLMAPSILAGATSRKDVSEAWINSISSISGIALGVLSVVLTGSWISKVLKDIDNK